MYNRFGLVFQDETEKSDRGDMRDRRRTERGGPRQGVEWWWESRPCGSLSFLLGLSLPDSPGYLPDRISPLCPSPLPNISWTEAEGGGGRNRTD